MKRSIFRIMLGICALLQLTGILYSQGPVTGKRLSNDFYKGRREALRRIMPDKSVVVLFSAPEKTFAADVDYVYHQDPDFFYFSGYTGPNSLMYIFKEEQNTGGKSFNEVMFIPEISKNESLFTGKKLNADETMKEFGISLVLRASEYDKFPVDLSGFKVISPLIPSDVRASGLSRLISSFKTKAGIRFIPDYYSLMFVSYLPGLKSISQEEKFTGQIKNYIEIGNLNLDPAFIRYLNSSDSVSRRLAKDSLIRNYDNFKIFNLLTTSLRQIKTEEEREVIQKAIDITCNAHREVMKAVNPDISESEVQGIHEFIYKKSGAREIGFPLIIASGNNGCILHYQENNAPRLGNNLLLMDVGAMYCGYSADVTRTIPANGKFSPEQLAVYNIVLQAQDSAFSYCRKGIAASVLEAVSMKVIADGLIKLGIISDPEQVQSYYPHGVSHPIGLDVHDKSLPYSTLSNGMILTLEPGIYIPEGSDCDKKWQGIAIRIEDDVLINDDNPLMLSLAAPRKAEDIENLMKEESPFNRFK